MGDKQARKLERGMGKPEGWIDIDRTEAENWKEAALLDKIRALTPDQVQAVAQLLDQMLKR